MVMQPAFAFRASSRAVLVTAKVAAELRADAHAVEYE